MKSFYTVLPEGAYNPCNYYFEEQDLKINTFFPIIFLLKEFADPDSTLYLLSSGTRQAKENSEHLLIELDKQNVSVEVKIVHQTLSGQADDQLKNLFRIIDTFVDGNEVFFDFTFGFKPIPMLMMIAFNYAQRFENIRIAKVIYGQYDFSQNGNADFVHTVHNMTSLLHLDNVIYKLSSNPSERIKQLLRFMYESEFKE